MILATTRYFTKRPFLGLIYDFRQSTIEKQNLIDDNCQRMRTHLFYGVTHDHEGNCKIKDGEIYGSFVYHINDNSFSNLVTLGGSTTDGFYKNYGKTWPSQLNDKFLKNNLNLNVINGGNGDFGSSQELLKLLIDVGNLENVKYVVSLSGINDLKGRNKYLRFQNKYPFWTNVQLEMFIHNKWINQSTMYSRFFPNILSFISAIKRRVVSSKSSTKNLSSWEESLNSINTQDRNAIEDWYYNVKMMNSISKTMGAEFYLFLQPTMGISEVQTPKDKNSKNYEIYNQLDEDYYLRINNHYKELKILCSKLDFCYDISDIASVEKDVYIDPRHHNEKGNKIIAGEIFKVIFNY